jgi:hypothetical protein
MCSRQYFIDNIATHIVKTKLGQQKGDFFFQKKQRKALHIQASSS